MTVINIPVLLLDDACRSCEELDIVTEWSKLYAGVECVDYDLHAQCAHVRRCADIQKRIREREKAKSE